MRSSDLQKSGTGIQAERVIGFPQVRGSRARVSRDRKPLRVVEHVEGLCTEFKRRGFREFEVLEQRHIKVGPVGVVQAVAGGIAKRQTARRGKCAEAL